MKIIREDKIRAGKEIGWLITFLILGLAFFRSVAAETYPNDSDGGRDPGEYGTCLEANRALMRDECFDETTLNEWFPDPANPGFCTSELISCPDGCENGVCRGVAALPPEPSLPPSPEVAAPPTTPPEEEAPRTFECVSSNTEGWFEPVQGVWQDDYYFPDWEGKQLTRLSPIAYRAELPLVVGRDTLLFGIDRAVSGRVVNSRDQIVVRGEANGSVSRQVKIRFEDSRGRIIYETPVLASLPIDGPCTWQRQPFELVLDAGDGIPPGAPFQMEGGPYRIEAKVVRADGSPTLIGPITVWGVANRTYGPRVHFVPLVLRHLAEDEVAARARGAELLSRARDLATEAATYIPDYFPLRSDGLPTTGRPPRILNTIERVLQEMGLSALADVPAAPAPERVTFEELLVSYITRELTSGALLARAGRVIALIDDFDLLLLDNRAPVAFATSQKLIFARKNVNHFDVAHELTHTLPFPWSDRQIQAECRQNFHNIGGRTIGGQNNIAYGHRIVRAGNYDSVRVFRDPSLMGAAPRAADQPFQWIDQCTFWHLTSALEEPPDPPMILAQGFLARKDMVSFVGGKSDARYAAAFAPFYEIEGEADLGAKSGGNWAIVFAGEEGGELARHPFDPIWILPTHPERELDFISFAYRLPKIEGVKSIELVGPDGVLAEKSWSANAPEVKISKPARPRPEDEIARLNWTGFDKDDDRLFYTVLYSPDGGATWFDQVFETEETAFDLKLDKAAEHHMVKVIATDGARSAEAVLDIAPEKKSKLTTQLLIIIFVSLAVIIIIFWRLFLQKRK